MSSPLKQNTITIQELLNTINNLPEAENLDTELNAQSTLLSEQDAKIAELAQVLAGKAGSGNSENIGVIKFFIDNEPYYADNGMTFAEYTEMNTICKSVLMADDIYGTVYLYAGSGTGKSIGYITGEPVLPSDKIKSDEYYIWL